MLTRYSLKRVMQRVMQRFIRGLTSPSCVEVPRAVPSHGLIFGRGELVTEILLRLKNTQ